MSSAEDKEAGEPEAPARVLDKAAAEALYREAILPLLNHKDRVGGSPHDVDDAIGDTAEVLLRRMPAHPQDEAIRDRAAYAWKIMLNVLARGFKAQGRDFPATWTDDEPVTWTDDEMARAGWIGDAGSWGTRMLSDAEQRMALGQAELESLRRDSMDSMPEKYRRMLEVHLETGDRGKRLADALGVREEDVKRLSQAKRQLANVVIVTALARRWGGFSPCRRFDELLNAQERAGDSPWAGVGPLGEARALMLVDHVAQCNKGEASCQAAREQVKENLRPLWRLLFPPPAAPPGRAREKYGDAGRRVGRTVRGRAGSPFRRTRRGSRASAPAVSGPGAGRPGRSPGLRSFLVIAAVAAVAAVLLAVHVALPGPSPAARTVPGSSAPGGHPPASATTETPHPSVIPSPSLSRSGDAIVTSGPSPSPSGTRSSPSPTETGNGPSARPTAPQTPGALTISPAEVDLANYGTTASLSLTAGSTMDWTATPSDPALTVTPSSGTTNSGGTGTPVTITVGRAASPAGDAAVTFRTTDGRKLDVPVHWRAPGNIEISGPLQGLGYFGSAVTVKITAQGGDLNWMAAPDQHFAITPSSGTLSSGDSTLVTYHLTRPAATDGTARLGIVTPDGQQVFFTVSWLHTPGTLSIGPASQDFGSYGSSVTFNVTVAGGASTWTVVNAPTCAPLSPACLLSVSPVSGSGSGTLTVNLYQGRTVAGNATITLQTADGQRQSVTVHWNVYGEPG